ncbi:N-6 DNA methylase [Pontibacillus yanchengensis]|nr:N-6 DNA methylase [Pontibacillus yanchengensis]
MNQQQKMWEPMDHLRGHVSSNDYKKYLMPLLTLAYVNKVGTTITVPYSANWQSLITNGSNIGERIDKALIDIEENNPSLHQALSIIYFRELPDSTIHQLAHYIDELPLEKEGGIIAEEILAISADMEGKTGGENLTPPEISELIVRLLGIQEGKRICDWTAGTAQNLINASKQATELELYGQEINSTTWAIAKMNLILNGCTQANYKQGNAIRDPKFTDEKGLKTFDYVGMTSPMGLKNWGREAAEQDIYGRFFYGIPPKSQGDMAFILHALASLNEEGKAVIVVPHGVLFRGANEAKIRAKLIQDDVIEAIIGLPSGLMFNTGIPVALLILNKKKAKERKKQILFVDAEEEYDQFRRKRTLNDEHIDKILRTYLHGEEILKYSKWVKTDELDDYSLYIKDYFEEDQINSPIGKVQVNKEQYQQQNTLPLKEIAELFRGMNTPPAKDMKDHEPTHKLVELSHLQAGEIMLEDLTPVYIDNRKKVNAYELQHGDIIVASRGSSLKMAVVPETEERILLSHHFIGIRPTDEIDPHFLQAFLNGPVGLFYLINKQKGTTVSILTAKDIGTIPIPHLPYEKQQEISQELLEANKKYEDALKQARQSYMNAHHKLYKQMGIEQAYHLIEE